MYSFRDVILFLAGFELFHTLTHLLMAFFFTFPFRFKIIQFTQIMNILAIIVNAAITVFLLWWAYKLSPC